MKQEPHTPSSHADGFKKATLMQGKAVLCCEELTECKVLLDKLRYSVALTRLLAAP